MAQKEFIERLKGALDDFPIKKAWLFGSYATGEERCDSDIDLLVDYDKTETFSLFTIGAVVSGLSRIMGRRVDVVENGRVLPFAMKSIDDTKILIYERKP